MKRRRRCASSLASGQLRISVSPPVSCRIGHEPWAARTHQGTLPGQIKRRRELDCIENIRLIGVGQAFKIVRLGLLQSLVVCREGLDQRSNLLLNLSGWLANSQRICTVFPGIHGGEGKGEAAIRDLHQHISGPIRDRHSDRIAFLQHHNR